MNKDDLLAKVADFLESQEREIRTHLPETWEVYAKGRDAFAVGQQGSAEEPWMQGLALTVADVSLLRRYMLSSSFISAWYHLRGEKARRDKAAHVCMLVVTAGGEEEEQVSRRYVDYERLWRRTLTAEGLAPARFRTPSAVALIYPVGAGLWMSARAPFMEALGYGVSQLGYLIAGSGLLFGSFRVLGLRSRWAAMAAGVAVWLLGVVLLNL